MYDDDGTEGDGLMIPWLGPSDPFPPLHDALTEPNGLLAAGADLSPARLLDAYRRGIFPWFAADQPILWWSPNPRMVLYPSELHVSRSLDRVIRSGPFTVTMDEAFVDVLAGCASPRPDQDGTWITDDMAAAYAELARLGHAHSVEAWADGSLAGGVYGVAIGRMFFGESMFSRRSNASKVALVHLVRQLARWGFEMIDCQMTTPHLASLGAREIERESFARHVARVVRQAAPPLSWRLDADLYNGRACP